jgi:hypothetical protein
MTECRRCGKECGGYGYTNTICNPWAAMTEDFTLCSKCQNEFARKTVNFLNDPEAKQ